MGWETGEAAQLSGSGRKTEIICCENLPAMRIFMRYGFDSNHEAIRGKTTQEKDKQVVASPFPLQQRNLMNMLPSKLNLTSSKILNSTKTEREGKSNYQSNTASYLQCT